MAEMVSRVTMNLLSDSCFNSRIACSIHDQRSIHHPIEKGTKEGREGGGKASVLRRDRGRNHCNIPQRAADGSMFFESVAQRQQHRQQRNKEGSLGSLVGTAANGDPRLTASVRSLEWL